MTQTRELKDGSGWVRLARAALPAVPGLNQLPGIKKTADELPDLEVQRHSVEVRAGDVAAYAKVCGFKRQDLVPLPYPHMLAFPLHMAIMTDPSFPFPAMGTVHLENVITRLHHVQIGDNLDLSARASRLRSHSKGRAFDIDVVATVDDQPVWQSTSTYLRIGSNRGTAQDEPEPGRTFATVASTPVQWRLASDLGRRYAAVSGDHNPIHLYPITAKAFGFPRQVAHGMWTKARAIAALETRIPEAVRVEAGFKKPILLPSTVRFGAVRSPEVSGSTRGLDFAVVKRSDGAPHLLGRTVAL